VLPVLFSVFGFDVQSYGMSKALAALVIVRRHRLPLGVVAGAAAGVPAAAVGPGQPDNRRRPHCSCPALEPAARSR